MCQATHCQFIQQKIQNIMFGRTVLCLEEQFFHFIYPMSRSHLYEVEDSAPHVSALVMKCLEQGNKQMSLEDM